MPAKTGFDLYALALTKKASATPMFLQRPKTTLIGMVPGIALKSFRGLHIS
jgi:hypothetical protein